MNNKFTNKFTRKYLSFFRLRFVMGLQYRAAALAGIATQFFWGAMEIMVFRAFYETDISSFPMEFQAMSSYVWLQQAFLAFFSVWMLENEIFDTIMNGNIAYELCRPISIYNMWFSRSMANRMSKAVLRCFPILFVAMLLPKPYGIGAPASMGHFVIFLITLVLGLMVIVAFCMLIYGFTFFTVSPNGVRILFTSSVEFLSGAIIPLPFFPEAVQRVLELLPFAAMQNVALRVYSGSMTNAEMTRAVVLQLFWLVVLVAGGKLLCAHAEKKVTVQGG